MGRRRAAGPSITLFSFQDIITSVTGIMILVTLLMSVELIQRRQKSSAAPVTGRDTPQAATTEQLTREIAELNARLESGRRSLGQFSGTIPGQIQEQGRDLDGLVRQLQQEAAQLQVREDKTRRSRDEALQVASRQENDLRETKERIAKLEKTVREVSSETRVVYNAVPGANKQAWLVELTETQIVAAAMEKSEKPRVFAGAMREADFRAWAATRDKNREYFVLLVKPSTIAVFEETRSGLRDLGFDLGYDLLAADQTAVDPTAGLVNR